MSTICKLDPTVREARYRRRQVAHEAQVAAFRATGLTQEAMVSFAHRLNEVRFSPSIRGTDRKPNETHGPAGDFQHALSKEQRFRNLFQQLRSA